MTQTIVIGGSGFIGSRLIARLTRNGHQSLAIIDKSPSFQFPDHVRIADIRDTAALEAAIDNDAVLIHLAAEHRDDVTPLSLYDDVNVGGARNICDVARSKNCRTIIFTSSVAIYGAAEIGTGEDGVVKPFNAYGRTKFEAEGVLRAWQEEAPLERSLTIIRPTVVFGERNRGNVYNLLNQIASGRFMMIGSGENRKSLAYVENVAAFIEYNLKSGPGIHIYNYIDKPDYTMNEFVAYVYKLLGRQFRSKLRLPYSLGMLAGNVLDIFSKVSGKKLPISAIRVKKFCLDSVYSTAIEKTDFKPPVQLSQALEQTVRYEFIEKHNNENLFYSE